ncbi:hypothetical protein D9M68_720040 [compost metagenome]
MPIGVVGTTAWTLVISVTNPVPSDFPYVNPPLDFETEAECRRIEKAINAKAYEAGVKAQLSAQCHQVEYVEPPAMPSKS